MPSRRKPAPRPYHHGDLRASLLQAAARWLDEQGADTLTLRELARAAGVSHAAPYHHFAGRDELLAGVAELAFDRLADALAAAAAHAADATQALLDIGEAYVRAALAHPAQFRLMFGPMLARKAEHPGLQRAAERAFTVLLAAATAHAPARGLELALAGWSLSHGAANLAIDGAFAGLPVPPAGRAQARSTGPGRPRAQHGGRPAAAAGSACAPIPALRDFTPFARAVRSTATCPETRNRR